MKIKIGYLLLTIWLAAVGVSAQTATAEQIVENSLQKIGGRKEISKVRNLRALADCAGPNGTYQTELYSATEARLIFKQIRAAGGVYFGQTNRNAFWTRDAETGDLSLADRREAFAWRSHDYQFLAMEIDERFRGLTFAGEEDFAGKTALRLNATDELGNPASVFFDKSSKRLLGFTIQNPFSPEKEAIRTVFNEWKRVGSLSLPSKVTATDNKGDFVLNFREITLNRTDEKIFDVPARIKAMSELLELHKQSRVAHFTKNARLLVSTFADDFTDIRHGKIAKPKRAASLKRFQNYLNNSTFLEWDDLTPPVIRVSGDATMGYSIVHKKVRLLAKAENGKEREETEIFAWVSIYRKILGDWKLVAVVSTNTPESD